jgi:preprotein translocase subunit SecF
MIIVSFLRKYQRTLLAFASGLALIFLSLAFILGLNLSLEFQGGAEIEILSEQPIPLAVLKKSMGPTAKITSFGSEQNYTVRFPQGELDVNSDIKEWFDTLLLKNNLKANIVSAAHIGAEFSSDTLRESLIGLALVLLGILAYVSLRFEWRLALSAIVALLYDPCVILGSFALFGWTFDLPTLMGLLSVIGYSINDTIVVFDRFRENIEHSTENSEEVFYTSLKQIFSRTLVTSFLTSIVIVALLVFKIEALKGFALAFGIGIITGTLSSIMVAGPLALLLGVEKHHLYPPVDDSLFDPLSDRQFRPIE